jgi:superfamily II DNA/RNA helicase
MLSETGSGKTLSYLLPMIEHMQRHEAALNGARPRPSRPRALVLLPTRELAVQTLAVAKKLSHVSQFSACGATGGGGKGRQTDLLHHGVDVVIGTPTRIVELAAKKELYYGDVRHVVIDECDTIMSSGWGDDVEKILGAVRKASASARQTHERRLELLEKAEAMSDAEKAQFLKRELTATPFRAGDTGEMQVTLVAATITAPVRAMLLEQVLVMSLVSCFLYDLSFILHREGTDVLDVWRLRCLFTSLGLRRTSSVLRVNDSCRQCHACSA